MSLQYITSEIYSTRVAPSEGGHSIISLGAPKGLNPALHVVLVMRS